LSLDFTVSKNPLTQLKVSLLWSSGGTCMVKWTWKLCQR
jgi:hypothetical protein